MRTVAVDFDGVIHGYSRGWQDGTIYDPPIDGALDALRLLRRHWHVVIYTTRAREDINPPGGEQAIRRWFAEHGAADLADELEITDRKPLAVALIDDRAIRFEDWDQALNDFGDLATWGPSRAGSAS